MKRLSQLFFFIVFTSQLLGQESNCFENSTGLYWPVEIGLELNYSSGNKSYKSKYNGDSIKYGGSFYYAKIKEYSDGSIKTSYWREVNGAVYLYEKESNTLSLELPSNPKLGQKWKSTNQIWSYEIVGLEGEFKTPYCEFTNLLEVKTKSSERNGNAYNLFYKKGIGMVGVKINGKPITYIKPNKEMDEKNFIAYGCEDIKTKGGIKKCTHAKIFEHIKNNFKNPNGGKKGKIIFDVKIGKDGIVQSVTVFKTLKTVSSDQEKEAIRVLKSLPRFIPAQVDTNQPINTSFKIPLNFNR